jgi:hypothetical protein
MLHKHFQKKKNKNESRQQGEAVGYWCGDDDEVVAIRRR